MGIADSHHRHMTMGANTGESERFSNVVRIHKKGEFH